MVFVRKLFVLLGVGLVSLTGCPNNDGAVCGNGTIEEGETCDDGNTAAGDGCAVACQIEGAVCGDNIVEEDETCDDGNTTIGDGCDDLCQREIPPAVCGNGVLEEDEDCDDGNTVSGDGCDQFCLAELPIVCGNSVVESGEQCDDGNTIDGDGCDALCQVEVAVCGDGVVEGDELCDGAELGGTDCVSEGFLAGTLGCLVDCTGLDTALCIAVDVTAPTFAGATQAVASSTSSIQVFWSAASDDISSTAAIHYEVFVSSDGVSFDFTAPVVVSALGDLSAEVGSLPDNTTFFFVVRAVDEAGNSDANNVVVSATTLLAPDLTPPVFAGLTSVTQLGTSALLSWSAATDETSAANEITYLVYSAASSGAQDFANPVAVTNPGDTSILLPMLANQTLFFVVRAQDSSGNIDTNTAETSLTAIDSTAPSFAGLVSATANGNTAVTLTWSAASDDFTAQANIVYQVFEASTSGAQVFSNQPLLVSNPGQTSVNISGLFPGTSHFFVVRAKDQSGNVDSNLNERGVTLNPVSLSLNVQPIFTARCAGGFCHVGAGQTAGGLSLSNAAVTFSQLVNVNSAQCGFVNPRKRVLPTDTNNSYLINKLLGVNMCSGSRMPLGIGGFLGATEMNLINQWVLDGALNN